MNFILYEKELKFSLLINAKNLKELKFQKNSEFLIIESINIPSSLTELKPGWCNITANLNKIIIFPGNQRYALYNDNKFIIGKSLHQNDYDCLVFCVRRIIIEANS